MAIPVISSGNYGFDFDYAFRIGLVTVYNELLEKKNEYRELFKEINLVEGVWPSYKILSIEWKYGEHQETNSFTKNLHKQSYCFHQE